MRTVRTSLAARIALVAWWAMAAPLVLAAPAKEPPKQPEGPPEEHASLGRAVRVNLQVGVKLKASGGPIRNFHVQVAAPIECPEQEVKVVDDEFTDATGDERLLNDGGARQLIVLIPFLDGGREARGLVTYEVKTYEVAPPTKTDKLHVPTRIDQDLKAFVRRSPFIEVDHPKIRKAIEEALADAAKPKPNAAASAAQITALKPVANAPTLESPFSDSSAVSRDAAAERAASSNSRTEPAEAASPGAATTLNDWRRIEAFYDYALKKIKYVESDDKSAVTALDEGKGDCQAVSALFVAMCRTAKIPARVVWADGHQYAEFYLLDSAEAGHWYPIESAGTRVFGGMPLARTIFQKGDNFRVPERRGESLRYASDFVKGDQLAGPPKVTFIHARE